MHRLCPVHTGEMRRSAELMAMGVARGLGTAGVPQYSVLERGGAHNTSGAVLGAGNTNVQRPASTFEDLLPGGEEKAGYRRPCTVRRGEQLRRRDRPEESFPNRGDIPAPGRGHGSSDWQGKRHSESASL